MLRRALSAALQWPASPTWHRSVAYGSVQFASSAMNNVFVTYYIDLFTGVVKLSPSWFYAGQLIFMVWNAVNDPLLGWLSDTLAPPAWCTRGGCAGDLVDGKGRGRRALAIRWGGLLWSLSFLMVWWPWVLPRADDGSSGSVAAAWWWPSEHTLAGLHFTAALCLYDGFLTFTEVNQEALLAEISVSERERVEANAWAAAFGALGAGTSLLAHVAWRSGGGVGEENSAAASLGPFRVFACCLSVVCAVVFELSARALAPYDRSSIGSSSSGGVVQTGEGVSSDLHQQQVQLQQSHDGTAAAASAEPESFAVDCAADASAGGVTDALGWQKLQLAHRGDGAAPRASMSSSSTSSGSFSGSSGTGIGQPRASSSVAASATASDAYTYADSSQSLHSEHRDGVLQLQSSSAHEAELPPPSYLAFAGQLVAQSNFRVFAAVQFTQQFDCTFEKNFFAPFLDTLLLAAAMRMGTAHDNHAYNSADAAAAALPSSWVRGAVIALSFMLPNVCTLLWSPVIASRGIKASLGLLFWMRIALVGAAAAGTLLTPMVMAGMSVGGAAATASLAWASSWSPFVVMSVMLGNRILSESACRLFPLVRSDVVDEDAYLHRRPAPLSAALVGSANFAGKFSQSLAPMLAYALMATPQQSAATASSQAQSDGLFPTDFGGLQASAGRVWTLLLLVPAACVALQLLAWRWYSLDGAYLKLVKRQGGGGWQ